jgi:hypothetical protein
MMHRLTHPDPEGGQNQGELRARTDHATKQSLVILGAVSFNFSRDLGRLF